LGDWDPAERMTERARERAQGKEIEYAETFRRMVLVRE
jgi:hypothetical protein